jgi:hypothetical protein
MLQSPSSEPAELQFGNAGKDAQDFAAVFPLEFGWQGHSNSEQVTVSVLVRNKCEGQEGEMSILQRRPIRVVSAKHASYSGRGVIAARQQRLAPPLAHGENTLEIEMAIGRLDGLESAGD